MISKGIVYQGREGKAVRGYNYNSLKQGWLYITFKELPQELTSASQAPLPWGSTISKNSYTNWRPGVQT